MMEKQHQNNRKQNAEQYNDMQYMIQVDHKFMDRVDDIVKSLELSNFKVMPDKKKGH